MKDTASIDYDRGIKTIKIKSFDAVRIDSRKNICLWHDGTLRPMKGHNGHCRWEFDGQIYKHHHGTFLDLPLSFKEQANDKL